MTVPTWDVTLYYKRFYFLSWCFLFSFKGFFSFSDIVFFQDIFLREPLYSNYYFSTLGLERDSPSMEYSTNQLDYEGHDMMMMMPIARKENTLFAHTRMIK